MLTCIFSGAPYRTRGVECHEDKGSHCPLLAEGTALSSKLNLVDLAGSERFAKTGTQGTTAKEAVHINKSLTFLEQVSRPFSATLWGTDKTTAALVTAERQQHGRAHHNRAETTNLSPFLLDSCSQGFASGGWKSGAFLL